VHQENYKHSNTATQGENMNIKFKDINPGMYPAKISSIKEERGPYGSYLRFNFTITGGELKEWSFYGIVKPNSFKQSKFYRWINTILENEPVEGFSIYELIGKQCRILLQKRLKEGKIYYTVADLV
jgi:hypothetical protein